MSEEIKRCKCGSKYGPASTCRNGVFIIRCPNCRLKSPPTFSENDAIHLWNGVVDDIPTKQPNAVNAPGPESALAAWLASDAGQACCDGMAVGEAMRKRIITAFEAGMQAAKGCGK